jgi:tetratricopeptide (TPR) repeat protein
MSARNRQRPAAAVPPRPPASPAHRDWWTWAAPLVVGLAALLAYANSLRNGFVWDDPIILTRQLVVFRSVGDVLAPPRDIPQFSPDYYRPLTIATYLLDRAVGGDDPFAFHLSVLLAHIAASVLVYSLALQLLALSGSLPRGHLRPRGRAREGAGLHDIPRPQQSAREGAGLHDTPEPRQSARKGTADAANSPFEASRLGAFAAGALFALHPIHTESVAWAAGRSDVLAAGFLLAALVVHGWEPGSWGASALAGLCAAAALGAKETAVALYPLMLLRDVLVPPRGQRSAADWARDYAGPLLAGVAYVLLRRNALGEFVGSSPDALPAAGRSTLDLVAALGTYIGKLLWPVDLNAYIDHIAGGPLTIALAALLVGGLALALWYWWTRRGSTAPTSASDSRILAAPHPAVPLFALVWLALTLMPSLAIVWKIPDAPLAERYLYLPSVGFCLLVGDLLARLWTAASSPAARVAIAATSGAILLAAAVGTVRRNPVWHDDIALWENTERHSQVSGMAARGLGTAYQQAGRAADARAAFERALARRNTPRGLQTVYNNLGTLAMYDGDYAAAQRYYEAALEANPNAADTLFNLGLAILQRGGRSRESAQAALPFYERALRLNPHDPDIEAALAQVADVLADRAAAVRHARRALELGARGQTADSLRAMLARSSAQ